ncbi:FMN-binding protein [Christiangramia aquimixticola]|uniref:FMN-binding protein n=1 Tax=Christiangramia aquimixticola TaxID=1697558 RepID=UPI003AA94349
MMVKNLIIIFVSFLSFTVALEKSPGKKIDREVEDVFEIEEPTYNTVKVPSHIKTPSKISKENFYKIFSNKKLQGYVYVDKAPSKTAQFDYLVIFDKNLTIVKTKVLVYREEYGGEIGSRRWLKQFIGKTSGDDLYDVAAISGATISVRSMKNAVGDILETVGILRSNNVI